MWPASHAAFRAALSFQPWAPPSPEVALVLPRSRKQPSMAPLALARRSTPRKSSRIFGCAWSKTWTSHAEALGGSQPGLRMTIGCPSSSLSHMVGALVSSACRSYCGQSMTEFR